MAFLCYSTHVIFFLITFRKKRKNWTRKGKKENDVQNGGSTKGEVECRGMNRRGWQPKNRDIISKGACTKTGGEASGNQPSSISVEAIARGAPYPNLHHPTHKMSSTHSHSFVNIQKYCFPFTETTIFCFKETTAWGANFLARSDRKVSAWKAIHFLNSREYSKCRNVTSRTKPRNRSGTYLSREA